MRFKILILLLCCALMRCNTKKFSFAVEIKEPSQTDIISSIDLTTFAKAESGNPKLFLVDGEKKTPVPSQVDSDQLVWIVEAPINPGTLQYEIGFEGATDTSPQMKTVEDDGKILLKSGDQSLLSYQFETVYPPEGVDSTYQKSGFIHPVWTPNGQVLTRIQPSDHYHHYGIWNPWTHVLFEGDTVDFWNIGSGQATVRFAEFTERAEGPVFSEYEALQEHVVFKKDGTEKVALNEWQNVRVYAPHNCRYVVDVSITYRCATDSPFKILEYRYAGLGWRATAEWDKLNSTIITSEGHTRVTADGTRAKWFIYQGRLGNDTGGMAWFSNPTNFNHPEPVRIWSVNMYDRGDVFANFTPTKTKDWLLEPGNTYTLKYRFVVFNGTMTPKEASEAWGYYSTDLNIYPLK